MNKKRLLAAGFASAVVMFAMGMFMHSVCFKDQYAAVVQQGLMRAQPALPAQVIWPLAILVIGFLFAWLYAAVRPRLGAGPKTAILLGLAIAFIAGFLPNVMAAAWGLQGKRLALDWLIADFAQYVAGMFVAGWLYKE